MYDITSSRCVVRPGTLVGTAMRLPTPCACVTDGDTLSEGRFLNASAAETKEVALWLVMSKAKLLPTACACDQGTGCVRAVVGNANASISLISATQLQAPAFHLCQAKAKAPQLLTAAPEAHLTPGTAAVAPQAGSSADAAVANHCLQ